MEQQLIRHFIAALSYRTTIAIKNAPADFANFELGKETRKPIEILNHMTMLIQFVLRCYKENDPFENVIGSWESETNRFYAALEELDHVLAEGLSPTKMPIEVLLQGPLADAMTHVGQLTMLRRMTDASVHYENYMKADIQIGHIRPL